MHYRRGPRLCRLQSLTLLSMFHSLGKHNIVAQDTHTRLAWCTGRIEISAQNHNYAVDPASLPEDVEVTHINLNDGTCAGMLSTSSKLLSIQYHPEASPGPHDGDVSFGQFADMMRAERQSRPGATSATGLPMVGV